MPGPFVDDAQVAQARGIASQVIEPVFDLIRRHTTISVERTVLRLFGMSGAGPGGVPLANLMADRLKAAGVLNRARRTGTAGRCSWGARARSMPSSASTALPARRSSRRSRPEMEAQPPRRGARARPRPPSTSSSRRIDERDALRSEFPMSPRAAQVRHRRHRQHLRRRRPGPRRRPGRAPTSSPSSARPRSRCSTTCRTAPPPRATAAPTRRRRTSASCARRSTTSRASSSATSS